MNKDNKYTRLANSLHNQESESISTFDKNTNVLSFVKTLSSTQSYYDSNVLMYRLAYVFSVVCQVATMVSSYTFFAAILAPKISIVLLPYVIVFLLLLIEVLKYVSFHKAMEGLFSLPYRLEVSFLLFASFLCIVSMYASIVGGGNLGIDKERIVSTNRLYDNQIVSIKDEIKSIVARNTWKGSTWFKPKDEALLHQKEALLSSVLAKKEKELNSIENDNQVQATTYRFAFAFFDLLFILCTVFIWNFKRNVVIEFKAMNQESFNEMENTAIPVTKIEVFEQPKETVKEPIDEMQIAAKIGFNVPKTENSTGGYNRICPSCGTKFFTMIGKKEYCTDACRFKAFNKRNQFNNNQVTLF